jgi:hypothetical protein
VRLALAVISGVLCALLFRGSLDQLAFDFGWLDYLTAGTLFGMTVLWPYLRLGHGLMMRALTLIGASALSYFCAVMTALNADAWFPVAPVLTSFLVASSIGVTIVLVTARVLVPLQVSSVYWLLGGLASLLGGAAMYAGFEVFGDTTLSTVVSYCVWHALVCIAVYKGHNSSDAPVGFLAALIRTRGRFSIVPGWMKLIHSTMS